MHFSTRTLASSLAIALLLPACGADHDPSTAGGTVTVGGSSTGSGSGTTTTGDTPTTTGDPETSTTSGTTETVEPTTTGVDPTTTGDPQTSTTSGTTTDEPGTTTTPDTTTGDPVQECLDMVPPGEPCAECACTSCPDEFQACQADPGCVAIRECAQENMCTGQDCLVPCGQVIMENGGFVGQPAMKAIALGMCIGSSCAERCGG